MANFQNRILRSFEEDSAALIPYLEPAPLRLRDEIVRPNTPISHVYFPESGQLSMIAIVDPAEPIEVAIIGRDGLSNPLVEGVKSRSPTRTIVQVAGDAYRVEAQRFADALETSRALVTLVHRYQQTLISQVCYTALVNGNCTIEERLARWLLMAHDRMPTDADPPIVHEFLADDAGVCAGQA